MFRFRHKQLQAENACYGFEKRRVVIENTEVEWKGFSFIQSVNFHTVVIALWS